MRIKFTQRHVVQQGDGKGPVYLAGEEYDVADETYARKYIRRGWAVEVAPAPVSHAKPEFTGVTSFPLRAWVAPAEVVPFRIDAPEGIQVEVIKSGAERRVVHAGRGRWNVIDADGNKLNDAPLSKEEADALAAGPAAE